MDDWIIWLIDQGGYWGIFLLMFVENIFPPIPSEVIMGLGGVAMARGKMEFWPLLAAGTIGSTLGNYVWFLVGDRLGYRRLRPLIDRWGRWLTMEWDDVERATALFRRRGEWVVFALRFSPLLRTVVSLPAGLCHMHHGKFLLFTFAGAALWNVALIMAGSWLEARLAQSGNVLNMIVIAALVLLVGVYLWRVATWRPGSKGPSDPD